MRSMEFGIALLLAALFGANGCANTATCDPDERFTDGMCLPKGSGAQKKPMETDAGAVDGSKKTGTFGADCLTDQDCGAPAPVCAIQPTDTKGFCTQIGCDADPTVCPSGWICFDASVVNPDYPSVCAPSN